MPHSPLEELILVYFATCAQAKRTRAALRAELSHWLESPPDAPVDALLAAGLLATEGRAKLALTPEGRAQAAAVLGFEALPSKLRWANVKHTLLLGRVLGLSGDRAKLSKPEVLVGALVAKSEQVEAPLGATANRVRDLLVCRALGMEPPKVLTLEAIRRHVLSPGATHESAKLMKQSAARAVGARSQATAELQRAALRQWLLSTPEPRPQSLEGFAEEVRRIASASPQRFGDDRVFISHVLRKLQGASFTDAGTQQLKQRLIEANRQRLVTLARADLVNLMDPTDLAESVTTDGHAEYHFVVAPAAQ